MLSEYTTSEEHPEPECSLTRPEFGERIKVWDLDNPSDAYNRLFICETNNIIYTVSRDTEEQFQQGLPFSVIQWDMMELIPDDDEVNEIEELKYQIEYLKGKVAEYEQLI